MTGGLPLTAVLSAAETRPAGGAALGEVLLATALGLVLTALLLGLVWLHRTRRWSGLTTAGERLGRATGVPAWVALPTILATVSLLVALFGMMWDISLHIDVGRDPGPLANPAHYFILFGLFGVFSAGVLACAMPLHETPGPVAVHFLRGWDVPVGGVLLAASGFYALLGFPLDDAWHRIFGQDVTLWGPTHLMLIGGAGLSLVGVLLLEQEGRGGASTDDGARKVGGAGRYLRQAAAMGGLLLGLSVFQGEYDFDVPQFRLVLEPFMIAGAAGTALVAARLFIGRGGAVAAAGFFLVIRGAIALIVGPALGEIVRCSRCTSARRSWSSCWPWSSPSPGGRWCSGPSWASSSARSGTPPRPAGRTSRRRCRGAATSSSRARSWRSRAAWPAASSACSSRSGCDAGCRGPPLRGPSSWAPSSSSPPASPTGWWRPSPTTSRPPSASRTSPPTRGRRTSPSRSTRPTRSTTRRGCRSPPGRGRAWSWPRWRRPARAATGRRSRCRCTTTGRRCCGSTTAGR